MFLRSQIIELYLANTIKLKGKKTFRSIIYMSSNENSFEDPL